VADEQRHEVRQLRVADEHALEELDDDRGDEEAEEEDEEPAEAVADDILDALLAIPAPLFFGGLAVAAERAAVGGGQVGDARVLASAGVGAIRTGPCRRSASPARQCRAR
jgi:hypothetical protein